MRVVCHLIRESDSSVGWSTSAHGLALEYSGLVCRGLESKWTGKQRLVIIRSNAPVFVSSESPLQADLKDASGFVIFPLVVHTLDLVVSAAGIMSIGSKPSPKPGKAMEDPYDVIKASPRPSAPIVMLCSSIQVVHNLQSWPLVS